MKSAVVTWLICMAIFCMLMMLASCSEGPDKEKLSLQSRIAVLEAQLHEARAEIGLRSKPEKDAIAELRAQMLEAHKAFELERAQLTKANRELESKIVTPSLAELQKLLEQTAERLVKLEVHSAKIQAAYDKMRLEGGDRCRCGK